MRNLRVKLDNSLEETKEQAIVVYKDLSILFRKGLDINPFHKTRIASIFQTGKKLSQEQDQKEQETQSKRRGLSI